ncbi:hypothetical protein GOD83_28235 [Sinorhizobium medicae]|nr:hypothetical protein [Sinorhizobium medicae]MDX0580499.1 hypothetical protein [Sinorhizobium medicae]MDX0784127.1 hypothetical protein [Sinorhizobium medicae]
MKTTKNPPSANAPFTARENRVHTRFAIQAARIGGWETTSAQFQAMQRECSRRDLRACDFSHFRARIRSMRGYHMFWTTRRMSHDVKIDFSERPPRASSVEKLARALDRVSIIGW